MNKNILILSVLLALSTVAQAQDSGADTYASAKAAALKTEAAKPATEAEKPAADKAAAEKAAADKAAAPKPEAAKPAPEAEKPKASDVAIVDGQHVVRNENGVLQAFICEAGTACVKETLVTKNLKDVESIGAEIQKFLAAKKETEKLKVVFDKKAYEESLLAYLRVSVLEKCKIKEVTGRSGRNSKRSRDRDEDRYEDLYEDRDDDDIKDSRPGIQITSAQWAGLDLPKTDQRAECAVAKLEDKLKNLSDKLENEAEELGLDGGKLNKLPRVISELTRKISAQKDSKKKAQLELALEKVKALDEKIATTQRVARDFTKRNILKRAESDLADRAGYGFTYLHEMSATTPELFKGVRKDASRSILEVYRKQAQAHIALRDEANRATDVTKESYLKQQSIRFGTLATNYNSFMTYRHAQTGKSAGQMFLEKYSADADLNSKAVVKDVYDVYSPAAAQISNYLAASASGGTQNTTAIPGVLSVNGSDFVIPNQPGQTVNQPGAAKGPGRARRIQNGVNAAQPSVRGAQPVNQMPGGGFVPSQNGTSRGK
jgi:hypothetical protein